MILDIFRTFILPALILGSIGVFFGVLIAVFCKFFYVEEDKRIEELTELFPGYNCGSCGYPGCTALIKALLEGKADLEICKPLSKEKVDEIKEYLEKNKE